MCRAMEELCEKARREATLRTQTKFAISLWKYGIHDLERIARLTNLTVEDVKKALADLPE